MFDFYWNGLGTLTVEADEHGAPVCVLRPDGTEMNVETFHRAVIRLAGMSARYMDAVRDVRAAACGKEPK